jgi:hypothetical protein
MHADPSPRPNPERPAAELLVVCLCAGWCRLCEGYRGVLEPVCAELGLPWRWVDIEDEAELVGDVDIETFPTLLLLDAAGRLRHAGPVTPQPGTLRQLLRHALGTSTDAPMSTGIAPELQALASRLRPPPR